MGGYGSILLIEDNRGSRDVIKYILEKDGYDVTAVNSVEKGLDFLDLWESVDLIILDLYHTLDNPDNMRIGNKIVLVGDGFISAIESRYDGLESPPIIGMTSDTDAWNYRGIKGMTVECFVKPFRKDPFLKRVREILPKMTSR